MIKKNPQKTKTLVAVGNVLTLTNTLKKKIARHTLERKDKTRNQSEKSTQQFKRDCNSRGYTISPTKKDRIICRCGEVKTRPIWSG